MPTETEPVEAPDSSPAPDSPTAPIQLAPWGFWATALLGLAIAIGFTVAQAVAIAISWFLLPHGPEDFPTHLADGDVLSFITIFSGVVELLLIALLAKWRGWQPAKYLGFQRPAGLLSTAGWVAVTLILGWIHSLFAPLAGVESPPEFMAKTWSTTDSLPLLIVGIGLMAPLAEETFFRGFLHAGWKGPRLGILGTGILTSLLWTSLHIQYGRYELLYIFFFGILLTMARTRSGSIWTPIFMHAANNSLAIVGMAWEIPGLS
jgi:membrane protease YdiL (CAAX protease family)